jgi:hypothetical protein
LSRDARNAMLTARRVTEAVIAVLNQTPQGATADAIYAALTEHLTRADFDAMMRLLVEAERISRRGDRYFPAG